MRRRKPRLGERVKCEEVVMYTRKCGAPAIGQRLIAQKGYIPVCADHRPLKAQPGPLLDWMVQVKLFEPYRDAQESKKG